MAEVGFAEKICVIYLRSPMAMNRVEDLCLKSFNMRDICLGSNFNAVIVGKKGSGKSTIIQDMLYYLHKAKVPRICVFSGTESANGFFSQYVPPTFIFNGDGVEQRLQSIMQNQIDLGVKKNVGELDRSTDTRIVIVLDDLGFKKKLFASDVMKELFMNGRHHGIIMITAIQYVKALTPALRTNTDVIFVMKQNDNPSKQSLYESYFGIFDKPSEFRNVLEGCTDNFSSMVMDNRGAPSSHIPTHVFWYKAKIGRQFRIGAPELWAYHERWFMSDEDRYLRQRQRKQKTGKSVITIKKR